MQLLIVHSDAELGEQLLRMVKDYSGHDCDLAGSDAAAIDWGRQHSECALLLAQLEAEGIDGLSLGSSLSELFPSLQTLFFPAYPASDQRLEVADTKVFPEPIDGDVLLEAIARAQNATANARDLFHVVDIVQMCCLGRRSGAIQMVKDERSGFLFLRGGRLTHAETSAAKGLDALLELVGWGYVEFAYDKTVRAPVETITIPWDEALIEALTLHKQHKMVTPRRQSA